MLTSEIMRPTFWSAALMIMGINMLLSAANAVVIALAVRIVVVANLVMSLDNVIAVAAAAKGNYVLLGLGLAISIPIVIAGSALFLAILERFPWVVWAGGALLGWIAGGLLPDDAII